MSFTAAQIVAWKLVGTEGSTVTSFDTPTQAAVRDGGKHPIDNSDTVQVTAKALADARVVRRQQGKES